MVPPQADRETTRKTTTPKPPSLSTPLQSVPADHSFVLQITGEIKHSLGKLEGTVERLVSDGGSQADKLDQLRLEISSAKGWIRGLGIALSAIGAAALVALGWIGQLLAKHYVH